MFKIKIKNQLNFFQIIKVSIQKIILDQMAQAIQSLQIVKQLYNIYPDIQGQLCSRHSTLFGKLRKTFNKLYDNMQPTHYIIVKGTCQFVQQQFTQLKLSMALQNGIIILISKTYANSQIFVNSNHFTQQIIFSPQGVPVQGVNPWNDNISSVLKDSLSNMYDQYGGIMYIHANIPQNSFKYKQSFLMAIYVANLMINDNIKNFTKQQLVQKMSKLKCMGSKQDIERQFLGYKNRKFNLILPDLLSVKDKSLNSMNLGAGTQIATNKGNLAGVLTDQSLKNSKQMDIQTNQANFTNQNLVSSIQPTRLQIVQKSQLLLDMNKDQKFLFCKLDLAKQDVNYQFNRRKQIQIRKNQLLQQLYESHKINGLFDLFHHQQINLNQYLFKSQYQKLSQPKSMQQLECNQGEDQIQKQANKYIIDYNQNYRFLQVLLHQINLVSSYTNETTNLETLVQSLWQINAKYLKLHSQEVVQLVEDMKQRLKIKGCMVVGQNFLLIVIHKNKFTQLLCEVKEKINKGELKSKSLFKIEDEEEMILQRWSNDDKGIGQKMFTSVPAEGVGIFDPSEAIWFD